MIMQTNTSFKQQYPLEKRLKLKEQAFKKKPDKIIVIVEKDTKCKVFPILSNSRFSIGREQKIIELHNAIRKRIVDMGAKYENHSLYLFTRKVLPNKEMSIEELYNAEKDLQDGLLYLKYSNMEPFGKFSQ